MADADPAPAALPEANPELASDAELTERAAALVAALRSGDSDAQKKAATEITKLVVALAGSQPPQPAKCKPTHDGRFGRCGRRCSASAAHTTRQRSWRISTVCSPQADDGL